MPLFSYAETGFIDHAPFKLFQNFFFVSYSFSVMLKLALLTTILYSHVETRFIDHAPLHPCSNNCCFSTLYNSAYSQLVSELFSSCLLIAIIATLIPNLCDNSIVHAVSGTVEGPRSVRLYDFYEDENKVQMTKRRYVGKAG
jgi:hypothetical protein